MNTIEAFNEYALLVINYYVAIIQLEHKDYSKIDEEVRKNRFYLQPAKQRNYISQEKILKGDYIGLSREEKEWYYSSI